MTPAPKGTELTEGFLESRPAVRHHMVWAFSNRKEQDPTNKKHGEKGEAPSD